MQQKLWTCLFPHVRPCVLQDTILQEEVEGLVEEDEEETAPVEEDDDIVVGAIASGQKKTERQRKKEKAEKIKVHT